MSLDDWDTLFGAIECRLKTAVDQAAGVDVDPVRLEHTALDCLQAVSHLQRELTEAQQRLGTLEHWALGVARQAGSSRG